MNKYSRKIPAAKAEDKPYFKKLTEKQLAVYYWFVSKSYWNSMRKEDHYFIYYSDINYAQIARELGIGSVNTVKTAIKKLEERDYLINLKDKECYLIPHKSYSTYLDINLIKFLLAWSTELGAEIILFYSVLKRCLELSAGKYIFTIRQMVKSLGHCKTDSSLYKKFKLYVCFLKEYDLIEVKETIRKDKGDVYIQYNLLSIRTNVTEKCNYLEDEVPKIDQEILDKVVEDLI